MPAESAQGPRARGDQRRPLPARLAIGFGKFWWDFLIGDTPELFVGVLVALAIVWALVHIGGGRFGWIAMPLVVADLLAMSAIRASRIAR